MTTYQQYLGRFEITTANQSFGVNAGTYEIPTGSYYICGYDSETTNQFAETFKAQLCNITGVNADVNYYGSNGIISIVSNVDLNITFDDSDLAELIGVDSSLSAASTHVANRKPRYTWRPSRGLSDCPVDINSWWVPKSTTILTVSSDGTTFTTPGNLLYDTTIGYGLLPGSEVKTPSNGTHYEDFQQFFVDVIHAGEPVRCYPDRTKKDSTSFKTGLIAMDTGEEGIGSFEDFSYKHIAHYDGLWDITIPIKKSV